MLEPSQDPEECGLVEIAAQRGVVPDGGPDREVRQPDSVSGAQVSSHEDETRVISSALPGGARHDIDGVPMNVLLPRSRAAEPGSARSLGDLLARAEVP
jgi:hypothetical protein